VTGSEYEYAHLSNRLDARTTKLTEL